MPTPGPSFTQTAAADQSPFTSGVSPSSGRPSGVNDSSPLIAYLIPTDSSFSTSGISSSASSICFSKSSCVNGSSVGDSAASSFDGMSSGSWRIARWAYEPISSPLPSWRSYMFVSMSRTIGNSITPFVSLKCGTGPTSIIWCTAGVSGIDAPAMRAIFGAHTPQAMTTIVSVAMSPFEVRIAGDAAALDVDAEHLGVREHLQRTELLRLLARDRAEAQRVDDADARRVEAADDHRLLDVRHELLDRAPA